jgi:hypothetical protein
MRSVEVVGLRLRQLRAGDVRRLEPAALAEAEYVAWNALVPDLVSTLTAPPVSRPYSAFRPPVFTSTCCTKSKFSVLPSVPVLTPVVFRPSMMYWFSALVDPLIDGPYVSCVTPGASLVMP